MDPKDVYLSKPWLNFYPEGVPHEIDVPETSVPDIFDNMADKYSKKVALIFYGKKIHYGKLKELTDRFAAALDGLGVAKGDTVALYLLNSPQYIIAYLGSLKAGAKVTPISPVYTSKEVKHQLEDSEARTIVCEDILFDNVEKSGVGLNNIVLSNIGDYLPALKKMFGKRMLSKAYGEAHVPSQQYIQQAGLHLFKNLIEQYPPRKPRVTIDSKTDIAALPYTGGTTGL
ncbi:MAG: AMP-binding protein, partial [Deltaproteobacteria bacterium]|nr:AMP-binding protein [Deltaproteobacteria bacterium]